VMDPLGFALENFDVVGVWRDRDLDADAPIDSSGKLSSGVQVKGPSDLRAALLARPDQFVQTVTEKVMTFALGRSLVYTDMPQVRAIVRQAATQGNTFEAILKGVVDSPSFRMRQLPGAPGTKQASLSGSDSPTSLTEPEDCAAATPSGASLPARCLADNRR
jgi:hypothetical protein